MSCTVLSTFKKASLILNSSEPESVLFLSKKKVSNKGSECRGCWPGLMPGSPLSTCWSVLQSSRSLSIEVEKQVCSSNSFAKYSVIIPLFLRYLWLDGCLSLCPNILGTTLFKSASTIRLESRMNWWDFGHQRSRSLWPQIDPIFLEHNTLGVLWFFLFFFSFLNLIQIPLELKDKVIGFVGQRSTVKVPVTTSAKFICWYLTIFLIE